MRMCLCVYIYVYVCFACVCLRVRVFKNNSYVKLTEFFRSVLVTIRLVQALSFQSEFTRKIDITSVFVDSVSF